MKYYKVKPEFDQRDKIVFIGTNNTKTKLDGILIGNELYTPRERERIALSDKFFEIVNVPKNHSYWFFGARYNTYTKGPVSYNERGQIIY